MRRLALVVALLGLGLTARPASANSCNAYNPWVPSYELPLGCPLVGFIHPEVAETYTPGVYVSRDGQTIDVTGAIETTVVPIEVYYYTIDTTTCIEHDYVAEEPFDRHSIEIVGAQVGELVNLNYSASVKIVEAAPCPTAEPPADLYCQDGIQEYWECYGHPGEDDHHPPGDDHAGHDHGGCSAGGGLGLAAAALLLGLRRRRRA